VLLQAARKKLNEVREALVHVFTLSAANLPKDIFFVPYPANGMIKQELYYELVNAHHAEHMVNIRSSAISGISNLNAPMLVQANTDTNSLVPTTLKELILNAKVPETNIEIFSSMELTSYSETDGRYLLLTDKKNLRAAEHMIDELIEYTKSFSGSTTIFLYPRSPKCGPYRTHPTTHGTSVANQPHWTLPQIASPL
jgi:hypothetical protein